MMLVLSPHDFQKLSPACCAEILKLLSDQGEAPDVNLQPDLAEPESSVGTEEVVNEEKQVLSLSSTEASDLLANISERSQQTLKQFALGQPVPLDALIGAGRPYKNYVELKRSFVGAVNRRLRTVSGNRNAALFSSDRDKTRIKVTAKTAQSLRRAYDMPEPLPPMIFCDANAQELDASDPACQPLMAKLEEAWSRLDPASLPEVREDYVAAVMRHFIDSGFELCIRALTDWDEGSDEPLYQVLTVDDPYGVLENWGMEYVARPDGLLVTQPGVGGVLGQPQI